MVNLGIVLAIFMTKIYLTIFLTFLFKSSFCQTETLIEGLKLRTKFRFGLSNTLNNKSFFSLTGTPIGSRITMIYLGAETGFPVKRNIDLLFGCQIVNKGFKTHEISNAFGVKSDLSYRFNLAYFEVPIYFEKRLKNYSVNLGMVCSFLIRSDFISEWFIDSKPTSTFYYHAGNIRQLFNPIDFGFRLGYSKKITTNFEIDLVCQKNLLNPYKPNTNELAKQQTFYLGLKYMIF